MHRSLLIPCAALLFSGGCSPERDADVQGPLPDLLSLDLGSVGSDLSPLELDGGGRDLTPRADRAPLEDAGAEDAAPLVDQPPLEDVIVEVKPDFGALEGPLRFRFPIHDEERGFINSTLVFGFDHDPADGNRVRCQNYAGQSFPSCYDDHDGSDFLLNGGFARMDQGSARIVAAAPGEVIAVEDGNYDRCHVDAETADVSCDGHEMRANFVKLEHPEGWETWYYHLRAGSVAVRPGDQVGCGDTLGLVGSSGYSSAPHLHFEVKEPGGQAVDPYAGPFSQPDSLWLQQGGDDELPGGYCDPRGATP